MPKYIIVTDSTGKPIAYPVAKITVIKSQQKELPSRRVESMSAYTREGNGRVLSYAAQ